MKLPFFLSGPTLIHLFKLFNGTANILETAFKSLHFDYFNFFFIFFKNLLYIYFYTASMHLLLTSQLNIEYFFLFIFKKSNY